MELKLPRAGSAFCSQECFKSSWSSHKSVHLKAKLSSPDTQNSGSVSEGWLYCLKSGQARTPKLPYFDWTGSLRPYPISSKRVVPDQIDKPDWADDGIPKIEPSSGLQYTVEVKTPDQIQRMRETCHIAREVLDAAARIIQPGVMTDEIDRVVHEATIAAGGYPSPLNYNFFPKSCCTSVNEVICHGIPDARKLEDGDIVNVDVSVYYKGVHADLNETYFVGNIDEESCQLVKCTYECLEKAISIVKPGIRFREIGEVISRHASVSGFSVARSYCGHGIGELFHCAPNIPHYARNKAVGVMKAVMVQILNVVAFCHLQGVVHRDLKPENFLYTKKDETSELKAIDFGLSDFVRPDERLNDIVGSAYYVAPEVLHRSYSTEADVWSIGVIAYILLCGSRPFWARTESGIFRAVLKADPGFDETPWPSLSSEAKDFVKRLLNKDPRKRISAAQALSHPWIRNYNDVKVPLDVLIFKLMKTYMRSSSLRKAALRALSKTLTADELYYLREQFSLLEPSKNGSISLENVNKALMKYATDAMKESRIPDFLSSLNSLQYRRMDFEEFCAAALSVHQLEALDRWEQHARCAYELFDKDGNRAIVIEELASELGLGPSIPVHVVLHDWIRHTDGKLSFLGFVKLLHGVSSRSLAKVQ